MPDLHKLFKWVASHGCHTELHEDHVKIGILFLCKDGKEEIEYYQARDLKEAKEILGY